LREAKLTRYKQKRKRENEGRKKTLRRKPMIGTPRPNNRLRAQKNTQVEQIGDECRNPEKTAWAERKPN